MHNPKLAAPVEPSSLRTGSVQTTPRVRIMFGDRELATFGTVGRAVGASTKDVPTGSRVVDPEGKVRARLSHFVTARGCWLSGWVMT